MVLLFDYCAIRETYIGKRLELKIDSESACFPGLADLEALARSLVWRREICLTNLTTKVKQEGHSC